MFGLPLDRIVAIGASGFAFFLLLLSIRKMREEMYVPRWAPIVLIVVTTFTVLLYIWLTAASVNWLLGFALLGIGLVIGAGQGQMTRLYYRGPLIFGKRTTGYLVFWGIAYLASLLLTQSGIAAAHALGVLGMMLALGVAVGDNLSILFRQSRLKRPEPAPVAVETAAPSTSTSSPSPVARPTTLPEANQKKGASKKPTSLPK